MLTVEAYEIMEQMTLDSGEIPVFEETEYGDITHPHHTMYWAVPADIYELSLVGSFLAYDTEALFYRIDEELNRPVTLISVIYTIIRIIIVKIRHKLKFTLQYKAKWFRDMKG